MHEPEMPFGKKHEMFTFTLVRTCEVVFNTQCFWIWASVWFQTALTDVLAAVYH